MTDHYAEPDERPLYGKRRQTVLRLVVLVGLVVMVLPIVANLYTVTLATAGDACRNAVAYLAPDASASSAQFELFGAGGIGWECYAVGAFGGDRHVASLGLIPGEVAVPSGIRT